MLKQSQHRSKVMQLRIEIVHVESGCGKRNRRSGVGQLSVSRRSQWRQDISRNDTRARESIGNVVGATRQLLNEEIELGEKRRPTQQLGATAGSSGAAAGRERSGSWSSGSGVGEDGESRPWEVGGNSPGSSRLSSCLKKVREGTWFEQPRKNVPSVDSRDGHPTIACGS